MQQTSFTTTMVVAYARPFSPGRGNINFPARLLRYASEELALHKKLIQLRNTDFAHTDASSYEVIPLIGKFIKNIRSIRGIFFTADEIDLFLEMTSLLLARIHKRLEELRLSGC